MQLPQLAEISKTRDAQIEFRGLNHNLYVGDNQFYDTQNLCATHYPVMCPRARRATVTTLTNAQGIFSWGKKLCWCAGGRFYYDGVDYGTVQDGEKQFVGMGAYVLIFPDGKRFHVGTRTMDDLAAGYEATGLVRATLCRMDGSDYDNVTVSDEAPTDAPSGSYWLDTSGDVHVLKLKSGDMWVSVPTTYVRISAEGIGEGFRAGDAVEISGATDDALNGSRSIYSRSNDSLVMIGVIDQVMEQTGGLVVRRTIPQMDFVCELNNRVWGCSNSKHEIYACKLGDPSNWYAYDGLASDSYAATVGSDGEFTGCCSFGGQVLFWKENVLHKVLGTKPSNFTIHDTVLRGVARGSEKSLAQVNEVLLYHGREGIYAYDGGMPTDVSDALGSWLYTDASAGSCGDRYYVSMKSEKDDAWSLFVFDESKGLWFREDDTQAIAFSALGGQLYYLRQDGAVMAVRGRDEEGATLEDAVQWYAETGDMLATMPDNKYVSRVQVRAGIDTESVLRLEMQYDSSGVWEQVLERTGTRKTAFTTAFIPRRCDHFRMRFSGVGGSCVYMVSKVVETGSEL